MFEAVLNWGYEDQLLSKVLLEIEMERISLAALMQHPTKDQRKSSPIEDEITKALHVVLNAGSSGDVGLWAVFGAWSPSPS